jgi:hypothetical protein
MDSTQTQQPQAPGKGHTVTVTGLEIKEAAIAQGVQIDTGFQLSEELPSGETRIIGDADVVTVNKHSTFTAVAGDDNS